MIFDNPPIYWQGPGLKYKPSLSELNTVADPKGHPVLMKIPHIIS